MCLRYARYAYVTYLHTGVYGYYVTYVARNTLRTLRRVETGFYSSSHTATSVFRRLTTNLSIFAIDVTKIKTQRTSTITSLSHCMAQPSINKTVWPGSIGAVVTSIERCDWLSRMAAIFDPSKPIP